jgi:hypothetical protein
MTRRRRRVMTPVERAMWEMAHDAPPPRFPRRRKRIWPKSKSVRTVSGGLPSLGKGR